MLLTGDFAAASAKIVAEDRQAEAGFITGQGAYCVNRSHRTDVNGKQVTLGIVLNYQQFMEYIPEHDKTN
jgi:hypothetical protein